MDNVYFKWKDSDILIKLHRLWNIHLKLVCNFIFKIYVYINKCPKTTKPQKGPHCLSLIQKDKHKAFHSSPQNFKATNS